MSDTMQLGVLTLNRQAYLDLCEKHNEGYFLSSRQQDQLEEILITHIMHKHINKCGLCGWCKKNAEQFLKENPIKGETK